MSVKASMADVHLMMVEQMQRLNEADGDELASEVDRTRAMADLGKAVVANASLMVRVAGMRCGDGAPKVLTEGEVAR